MFKKKIAGISLIEGLVSLLVMLMALSVVVPMMRTTGRIFTKGPAELTTKDLLAKAVLKMSPILRNTYYVDVPNTTTKKLTVILPKVDATTGSYYFPLQPGDSVCFYLSDKTGKTNWPGTILWKSVNGVPDASWSLISGKGAVDLGTSNLTFSYDSVTNPSVVTINVGTSQYGGKNAVTGTMSTSVLLRNHKISGL